MSSPNLTPGKVADESQTLSERSSGWLAGAAWAIGLICRAIAKLHNTKGFNSQRTQRVTKKLQDIIVAELTTDVVHELPGLLVDPQQGLSRENAIDLYNMTVPYVLKAHHNDLAKRTELIAIWRGKLAIPGWEICGNPTCARLFEATAIHHGLCSAKCEKSVSNRMQWERRKEAGRAE